MIKLTGVPHPDINGGLPWPVYIDASRVLMITRTRHQQVKLLNAGLKRELYDDLYGATQRLTERLNKDFPSTIDNEKAAGWAKDLHMLAHAVNEAASAWGRAFRNDDFHPDVECTELQLACGTALEHGVMLSRVWVSEAPEEVALALRRAKDGLS